VILCGKDEVHAVFELCKQAHFDDYVPCWPQSQDGPRLAMSVCNAGCQASGLKSSDGPLVQRDHLPNSAPAQVLAGGMG